MATRTAKEPEVVEETEDVVEILEPKAAEYTLILGEGTDEEIQFVQKPLTFMGKIKLFSVLSSTLRMVLDQGVSVSELLDVPDTDSLPLSGDSNREADVFIKTITQVLEYAPEALGDIFCVILAVPNSRQEYIKDRLDSELTDEQAFAVLNTFVDQNWEVLTSFFTEEGIPLFKKITKKFQR